jgi:hypothetical protein
VASTSVQALAAAPDIDRAVGRIFLARAGPSEFAATLVACAALPEALLGVSSPEAAVAAVRAADAPSLAGATAELLQSSLRAACDPDVRPDTLTFPLPLPDA